MQPHNAKTNPSSETTDSTLIAPELKSGAAWLASADAVLRDDFLNELTEGELLALPFLFEFWALDHQLAPSGDWRSWVILGGRGAGKTRAGAEWVRSMVEGSRPLDAGRAHRVALVGETLDQVREVMVFGESGLLACSPPDRRPTWSATRRVLTWPNGAEAHAFSAHDPEALRGPQFDAAWADELGKWRKGEAAWDMLQFSLRLGDAPRACVTTTPRNSEVLKRLLAASSTVVTRAATEANAANLAETFLEEVRARYAGSRLGRQELDGELLEDHEGALWTLGGLHEGLVNEIPQFDRIVVAVDPPVSAKTSSDECGIVVVGACTSGPPQGWRAVVLEDASVQGQGPLGWAKAAIAARDRWSADRLVAEVNQGGDLVENVLRQVDPLVPLSKVHATRSKSTRAEPVAALYEQGRVSHVRGLSALERQMTQMTLRGFAGQGSPDRVDALVWAITDLLIAPAAGWKKPRLRAL